MSLDGDTGWERAVLLVDRWVRRYGEPAHLFACHAALPLTLTVDLAQQIHGRFSLDSFGHPVQAPWYTVGDLLLSPLVQEVGNDLFRMLPPVRDVLLEQMVDAWRLGDERLRELAKFLLEYAEKGFDSALRGDGFKEGLKWTALAHTAPEEASQEIARKIKALIAGERIELVRVLRQTAALAAPLGQQGPRELVDFAAGLHAWQYGELEEARQKLGEFLQGKGRFVRIAGVRIELPEQLIREVAITPSEAEPMEMQRGYRLTDPSLDKQTSWPLGRQLAVRVALLALGSEAQAEVDPLISSFPPEVSAGWIGNQFSPDDFTLYPNPAGKNGYRKPNGRSFSQWSSLFDQFLATSEWLVIVIQSDNKESLSMALRAMKEARKQDIKILIIYIMPKKYSTIDAITANFDDWPFLFDDIGEKVTAVSFPEFFGINRELEPLQCNLSDLVLLVHENSLKRHLDALWDLLTPTLSAPLGMRDLLDFRSRSRLVHLEKLTGSPESLFLDIPANNAAGEKPAARIKFSVREGMSREKFEGILKDMQDRFGDVRWSLSLESNLDSDCMASVMMEKAVGTLEPIRDFR